MPAFKSQPAALHPTPLNVRNSMDRLPLLFRTGQFARECWLWVKTEWRLHLSLAILSIVVGAAWAFCAKNSTLFARSGAVMSVFAAVMTYRGYFRGKDLEHMSITGHADRRAFSNWRPFTSKEDAKREDRSAFRWGLRAFIVGTLIWAYGDLWLSFSQ